MPRRFVYTPFVIAVVLLVTASMVPPSLSPAAETAAGENGHRVAIFAGGCFWCVESDFDKVPGVTGTVSGYTGGGTEDPTYRQVSAGGTGHREAVKITYDPKTVSYDKLLHVFWRSVDPTDGGGQFCDRGDSYATAIFATDAEQRAAAEASKKALMESGVLEAPIVTPVEAAGAFYPAEDYHQDYYKKNPIRYKIYRYGCGRDGRIKALWGDQAHDGIPHG
jgi:peptide-methionine (S)-S-oxide reductase